MKQISGLIALIVILTIALHSCKKDDPVSQAFGVTFQLEHLVGGEHIEYNNIRFENEFGNKYSVERLQYFISDIRINCACGAETFIDEEFYVDGLDENSLSFKVDDLLASGSYSSISFIFGLPEGKNVDGRFPNPPENNMEWPPPLGGGYHYMKLEGKTDSAGTINNFQAHTGPTNGNQNFIEVTLTDSDFTVGDSDVIITIRMEINNWWRTPNVFDLNQMTMVMGNQEVQQKLHDNGQDVFSLGPILKE